MPVTTVNVTGLMSHVPRWKSASPVVKKEVITADIDSPFFLVFWKGWRYRQPLSHWSRWNIRWCWLFWKVLGITFRDDKVRKEKGAFLLPTLLTSMVGFQFTHQSMHKHIWISGRQYKQNLTRSHLPAFLMGFSYLLSIHWSDSDFVVSFVKLYGCW